MAKGNRPQITVETSVRLPSQKVWELWTSPEHITKWNFASDDWLCLTAKNELKPGGRFQSRMEAKDGSMGFDFSGIYDQITPYKLITYTIDDGRKVEIVFSEKDGNTKVKETFEAEDMYSIDQQKNGWQAILENFKRYAESKHKTY